MTIEITRNENTDILVARVTGRVSAADVQRSIEIAVLNRVGEPGMDRIIIVDRQALLDDLTLENLIRIQQQVLANQTRDAAEPAFRSVLVADERVHRGLFDLYRALWANLGFPKVQISIADTEQAALKWLGKA